MIMMMIIIIINMIISIFVCLCYLCWYRQSYPDGFQTWSRKRGHHGGAALPMIDRHREMWQHVVTRGKWYGISVTFVKQRLS